MIPHAADILVCDGSRALVLRNAGTPQSLDIQVRLTFDAPPNPPTREQGADRPPRVRSGDRRSAIDQTDRHDLAEPRFAEQVVGALERLGAPCPSVCGGRWWPRSTRISPGTRSGRSAAA
ncbi:host attachment protein [Methylobacterium sp. Leaf456]|uniref:host attachment protein n=1 Tax=Methylobacterium sp. Leaf456 TaxID=1736382 RepID=UPI002571078D|nr:host attachment protein [Methylobacterium sp. Leaf456]